MRGLLASMLLVAIGTHAGLEWETQEIILHPHPLQLSADAVFRFSNTGKQPVEISDVRVTCGCLVPKLAKRVYAPGESGELGIRFDLRNRLGMQRKHTVVTTDDGGSVNLFIETDIPAAYSIEPRMLSWPAGDKDKNKIVRLANPNEEPIKLLGAESSHKDLSAKLKPIREGFEYEVVVTRAATAQNARAVIRIQTEPPPGQTESKTLKLYVHAQ